MSSDQYYPYDPQQPPQYEPQGGVQAAPADMETTTQTWQGQTWDTSSQPVLGGPAGAAGQPGQPVQPGQHPQPQQAAFQQQPSYGAAAPHATPYTPAPQQFPLSAAPSAASMEETAYLPVSGGTGPAAPPVQGGAQPLPPEVPADAPGHSPGHSPGPAAPAPYAAETELLPPVPASPSTPYPAASYPGGHPGTHRHAAAGPGSAPGAGPSLATPGTQGPAASVVPPGPGVAAGNGSGYGAATTLGNTRITDAQRARAEGRSPIIPPGIQPAGLTAVLALLLAGGAALGSYGLLVPVVILQAVTAAGWFRLNGMWPARQGIALAFLGGLVADVALLVAGKDNGPAVIMGTLGVWVLLTVVLQLRSHADPDTRLSGLFATVVSAALAIIATGYLASTAESSDAVIAGAVVVAVTTLVRALPLPGPASVAASLVVAALAGLAMGGLTDFGTKGLVLGLGAGLCALVGLRAASYDYPSRFVHMTAGVALPLTAAAPVIYLLGRALG